MLNMDFVLIYMYENFLSPSKSLVSAVTGVSHIQFSIEYQASIEATFYCIQSYFTLLWHMNVK